MKKVIGLLAASVLISSTAHAQGFLDSLKKSVEEQLSAPSSPSSPAQALGGLSQNQIVSAFQDALSLGTKDVLSQVGAPDGFNLDNRIRIPLPPEMERIRSVLDRVGLSSMTQDLETRLNRAAEKAAPQTADIFLGSINKMTLEDAQGILDGPKDSATKYFQRTASSELEALIRPIAQSMLNDVGALQLYDQLIGEYKNFPFVPDLNANLVEHTTQKTMDGIFYYLGAQEAEIRDNPSRWTTDMLKTVFGS